MTAPRKAISKRLRFEILKRDNHACRYCGAAAPEARLTVDHVVPVALGGSDDPSNLVAACVDCNAGKSSSAADAALVDDVKADAIRWAKAMHAAVDAKMEEIGDRLEYLNEFHESWLSWKCGQRTVPLPNDWRKSLAQWFGMGLPVEIIRDAIPTAMTKTNIADDSRFRYLAGIVWRTIEQLNIGAMARIDASPDGIAMDIYEAWNAGFDSGYKSGKRDGESRITPSVYTAMHQTACLSKLVDGPEVGGRL